ncbi:MAG: hypothetical protein ACR2L8_10960 [Solirubrobacteraceae bacterium]
MLGGVIGEFVESGVERADAGALVALQRQAMVGATEERNARASADAEDQMGALLEARGVPDAWRLAEPLASAGLDAAWLEQLAQRAGAALPAAARWIAASLTARSLSEELREATDRMSALVRAIKAYTYMDQAALQEVDVHEGIDATLTILGHSSSTRGSRSSAATRPTSRACACTAPSSARSGPTCSTTRSTRSVRPGRSRSRPRRGTRWASR